jgi:sugar phosphate isomerase/epimerase
VPAVEERIGISTHFLPATHGESIFDAIRMVHDAGFAGFEIVPTLDQAQLGPPCNSANVGIDLFEANDAEIDRLSQALSVFKWVTIHAPHLDWNLASINRHLLRLTWEYYDKCVEFAIRLKALAVTFHPGGAGRGQLAGRPTVGERNVEFAQRAIEKARPHGLAIGYEVGSFDALKYVCDRVPGWGINFDIGHARMAVSDDDGYFRFLDAFQGRVAEVHHNGVNSYWGAYMEHQPPHLNNLLDFPGTYGRLKESGYPGPIICEIQGHDIAQVIRHCQESKDMICGLWNGTLAMPNRWYEG